MTVKCQYCKQEAKKVDGLYLYPHIEELANNTYYVCEPCKAWVGCHKGTDTPMGTLANMSLRRRRNAAHKAFDRLYKEGFMKRTECYTWLAFTLNIPTKFCHIGLFNEEQCLNVTQVSKEKLLEYLDESPILTSWTEKETNIQKSKSSISLFRDEE